MPQIKPKLCYSVKYENILGLFRKFKIGLKIVKNYELTHLPFGEIFLTRKLTKISGCNHRRANTLFVLNTNKLAEFARVDVEAKRKMLWSLRTGHDKAQLSSR